MRISSKRKRPRSKIRKDYLFVVSYLSFASPFGDSDALESISSSHLPLTPLPSSSSAQQYSHVLLSSGRKRKRSLTSRFNIQEMILSIKGGEILGSSSDEMDTDSFLTNFQDQVSDMRKQLESETMAKLRRLKEELIAKKKEEEEENESSVGQREASSSSGKQNRGGNNNKASSKRGHGPKSSKNTQQQHWDTAEDVDNYYPDNNNNYNNNPNNPWQIDDDSNGQDMANQYDYSGESSDSDDRDMMVRQQQQQQRREAEYQAPKIIVGGGSIGVEPPMGGTMRRKNGKRPQSPPQQHQQHPNHQQQQQQRQESNLIDFGPAGGSQNAAGSQPTRGSAKMHRRQGSGGAHRSKSNNSNNPFPQQNTYPPGYRSHPGSGGSNSKTNAIQYQQQQLPTGYHPPQTAVVSVKWRTATVGLSLIVLAILIKMIWDMVLGKATTTTG